jgi:hypothetical protein
MDVASIVGTHEVLDFLGYSEATLLGGLFWK